MEKQPRTLFFASSSPYEHSFFESCHIYIFNYCSCTSTCVPQAIKAPCHQSCMELFVHITTTTHTMRAMPSINAIYLYEKHALSAVPFDLLNASTHCVRTGARQVREALGEDKSCGGFAVPVGWQDMTKVFFIAST